MCSLAHHILFVIISFENSQTKKRVEREKQLPSVWRAQISVNSRMFGQENEKFINSSSDCGRIYCITQTGVKVCHHLAVLLRQSCLKRCHTVVYSTVWAPNKLGGHLFGLLPLRVNEVVKSRANFCRFSPSNYHRQLRNYIIPNRMTETVSVGRMGMREIYIIK